MRAKDYRSTGLAALRGFWGLSIAVTLVAGLFGANVGSNSTAFSSASANNFIYNNPNSYYYFSPVFVSLMLFWGMILMVYGVIAIIFGGAVALGLCQYNIDLVGRRNQPQFNTLFSRFSYFGKAFLLQLAISVFTLLWTLLFIIPGIIASYRYAMAPFLMAQNPNLGVMEAIGLSKQMMSGKKGRLFYLDFSFIGWMFVAIFTFGIGLLWLIPYMNAARAAFYLDITSQLPGQTPPNGYGMPPYGAPPVSPTGYGAPPVPPTGYGAPAVPPTGYGAPPVPPTGYGAPPVPPTGYGAPPVPPTGYGAPPVPPTGYGAPPVPPTAPQAGNGTPPAAPPAE